MALLCGGMPLEVTKAMEGAAVALAREMVGQDLAAMDADSDIESILSKRRDPQKDEKKPA